MSRRVIIGVHGLGNKPKPKILGDWWMASIAEGLVRHCGGKRTKVRFELVYWADLVYPEALDPANMLEPYVCATGSGPLPRGVVSMGKLAAGSVRSGMVRCLGWACKLPVGENFVHKKVKAKMPDLYSYRNDEELRQAVQSRLIKRLRWARRWRREVMLVAHSMGSIVAYDVLKHVGESAKGPQVAHFVTIGSPLGLADLRTVVDGPLAVPECVEHWTNLSDPRDPVSGWDSSIAKDYAANSRGVTVSDRLVANGYCNPQGRSNPHKIFGYLRTPEVSELIAGFLR